MTRDKFGRLTADACPRCGKDVVTVLEVPNDTGVSFTCRPGFTVCVVMGTVGRTDKVNDARTGSYYIHPSVEETIESSGLCPINFGQLLTQLNGKAIVMVPIEALDLRAGIGGDSGTATE